MERKRVGKLTLCMIILIASSLMLISCDQPERRNCVVMLGDSIFALSGAIERNLREISGQQYKTYYMSATQMAGGVNDIESQYDRAARQGKIRTIIMDGGGNDFLLGGGFVAPNTVVNEISAAYKRIFNKAVRDGVENIVVMGYYKTSSTNSYTDKSEAEVRDITLSFNGQNGMKTAHFDPSDFPYFSNKRPAQYTVMDGIHPNSGAARELAGLIWQTMQQNDMEQGPACQGF